MRIFEPDAPNSNSIVRPPCIKCGTQMFLARIEPLRPNHDRHTFECPECGNSESLVVKYQ
jgi:predicted RNA-binding Zn-ribbon protein involved in translation (DUF1610 family)